MQVKKQVRTRHGKMDWFQVGKWIHQGCILSPCVFNLYAEYIMQNARLDEGQAGMKIAKRNNNNFRYADDATLMVESKGEVEPLNEVERGEWKSWLKIQHSKNKDHGIWSHHFMANRWGSNGNSGRFYFFGGGAPKSLQMVTVATKLKAANSLKEKLWQT